MNIEEILNSSILTDYCLGLLTEKENDKIEKLCLDFPEIDNEVKLLKKGLEAYAIQKNSRRSEGLKDRIWKAIEKINEQPNHK